MRRRYIVLLAIVVPVGIIYGFDLTHTPLFEWLMGYLVAIAILFKTSLLSLWLATKLKFITFLKGLTLFQALYLLVKRWLMDNVFIKWLKEKILIHFVEGLQEAKNFYLHLNLKAKLRHLFQILLLGGVVTLVGYLSGTLENILFFTQAKLLASALFQGIMTFSTKALTALLSWLTSSWIAPILQVFALSYILTLLERWLGPNNPISRFFNIINRTFDKLLFYLGLLKEKHLQPVECKMVEGSQYAGVRLYNLIKNKKIKEEFLYMERFENQIMQGHIDAYYSIKDMEKITDKKELYSLINQKTKDNIDIVAYVSRNERGELLEEQVPDSFYHDIFLLESFASHQRHGVKQYEEPQNPKEIDHTDFWVLNTSKYPLLIGSESNNFPPQCIRGHGLALIQTKEPFSYAQKDIYVIYQNQKVYVTPVER